MPFGRKPTVFISSTCYDLKQIRSNMRSFFGTDLGYDVLLSEYDSFPIDPGLDTVENCLRVVDERADIFVLIIGCRYGWVTDSGHSITNLEYLRARAKGIPIYAFVDKKVIDLLPIWKDNPGLDFKSTVDSPALFDFVNQVRASDSVWTNTYDTAQDITTALKIQLGYLFNDCLGLYRKSITHTMSPRVRHLDGAAFKIALEKPDGWEWKLFSQVLQDELYALSDAKKDFEYGITYAPCKTIESLADVLNYLSEKCTQLIRGCDNLNKLFNQAFPAAIGEPGVEGNADFIIYVANRIVQFYRLIIDWSLEFQTVLVDDMYTKIVQSFIKACANTLSDIESFSRNCQIEFAKIPAHIPDGAKPMHIAVNLVLTPPDLTAFNDELALLRAQLLLD